MNLHWQLHDISSVVMTVGLIINLRIVYSRADVSGHMDDERDRRDDFKSPHLKTNVHNMNGGECGQEFSK